MTFEKNKLLISFYSVFFGLLSLFAPILIYKLHNAKNYQFKINEPLSLVIICFCLLSVFCLFVSFKIYKSINHKIIVSDKGLLIEEISNQVIPWSEIKSASVKSYHVPKAGRKETLLLNTTDDLKYLKKRLTKIDTLTGFNGVSTADLMHYKDSSEKIIHAINAKLTSS